MPSDPQEEFRRLLFDDEPDDKNALLMALLLKFASDLPEDLSPAAFEVAITIPHPEAARLATTLAGRMSDDARQSALRQVLVGDPARPRLSGRQQAALLAGLGRFLSAEFEQQALAMARRIRPSSARAAALTGLVATASAGMLPEIIDLVRRIRDPDYRARGLAAAARRAEGELSLRLQQEALEAGVRIAEPDHRAAALAGMGAVLSSFPLLEARDISRSIEEPNQRSAAEAVLDTLLQPGVPLEQARAALGAARGLREPYWRAWSAEGIAVHAPAELRAQARQEAAAAARAVTDSAWQAALVAEEQGIAGTLSDRDRGGETFLDVVGQRLGPARARTYRSLLDALPPGAHPDLAAELVNSLVRTTGAGGPPEGTGTSPLGHGPYTVDQLSRLAQLRDRGVVSDDEFAAAKARVLGLQEPETERPESPRWILARVTDVSGQRPRVVRRAFRAATQHEVAVMIGPRRRGWMAPQDAVSVDEVLPPGAHEVTIVFFVPAAGPHGQDLLQTEQVFLPARGPTAERRFRFETGPPGSAVNVLISLVHKGCTLQTAELTGVALAEPATAPKQDVIKFRLAVVRPYLDDLDRQGPFDGSIQIMQAPDGRLVGFVAADRELSALLGGFGSAVDGIRAVLTELALDSDEYAHGLGSVRAVERLRRLALLGGELDSVIGSPLRSLLPNRSIARVQVIQTNPDAFVPVEFVYELPAPADDATLCRNWQKALRDGRCDPKFHHQDEVLGDLKEVCPCGFWAVTKLIERQSIEPTDSAKLGTTNFGLRGEPKANRTNLPGFQAALVAWSEKVNAVIPGQGELVKNTLVAVTGDNATDVKTWHDWAVTVKEKRPTLMVLLSHTIGGTPARLEIGPDGSGDRRALSQITSRLVKASDEDTPVVLLLGCDTTVVDREAFSFAARFRACGASVVVGTLTSVLGEHAAPIASALVRGLSAATLGTPSGGYQNTFGEVWRRTRSQLLADGELTALCVTAYGDADWHLG